MESIWVDITQALLCLINLRFFSSIEVIDIMTLTSGLKVIAVLKWEFYGNNFDPMKKNLYSSHKLCFVLLRF